MLVEIYSDVVCPWCYIGKRRFEAAVARHDGRVDIVWRPFQLDPRAPTTPTPVADAYARKFGGPDEAASIIDRVTSVAAAEGLDFRLDIAQRANTFDAHRLLWWAQHEGPPGRQSALEEQLMRSYFTQGEAVSDHEVLARAAARAGLDAADAADFLASDKGTAEVRAELVEGPERGVTAVPTFVFEGQWAVPGAQDADVFVRVLTTVTERLAATGPPSPPD